MIQNIEPYKLNNSFRPCQAREDSVCFIFDKGKLLGKRSGDGFVLPVLGELPGDTEALKNVNS